ncbi:MAG: MerR family transcriptional regulator [Deltaproteobacteria bacterium]|jgi:DNA-binding transcriptional MerR regulator|nr:MerR family transcriptional regulator [Deltaproteobacteria bacterium]
MKDKPQKFKAQIFSLDQLAALTDLPKRTIRYYIQIGLVPRPLGDGRAAHYVIDHLDHLLQIKRLTGAGVSLERIGEILSGEPPPVPPRKRRPGELTVTHHVHVARGLEIVYTPDDVGLNLRELREFASDVINLAQDWGLEESEEEYEEESEGESERGTSGQRLRRGRTRREPSFQEARDPSDPDSGEDDEEIPVRRPAPSRLAKLFRPSGPPDPHSPIALYKEAFEQDPLEAALETTEEAPAPWMEDDEPQDGPPPKKRGPKPRNLEAFDQASSEAPSDKEPDKAPHPGGKAKTGPKKG